MMLADRCYVNLSKGQLIALIKGKTDKNNKYKVDKLEKAGARLYRINELFKYWKND
jgi:hypothetical protein